MLPAADCKHLHAVLRSAGVLAALFSDLIPLQHGEGTAPPLLSLSQEEYARASYCDEAIDSWFFN
ncbi:hypothetical protein F8388_022038 [Cannabis sativa]|uniref:Uncharacterized protein n=1 Tax=Cannabis sativa TaxID=3483 RepID=A0A7J6G7K7_CANSA|nr:hypothetical protein F8388_022038 [Cannabis sativa]